MAVFVLKHSDPPLSITLFPALRHNTVASIVTFGLLSYIIPITPRGTDTLSTIIPFGLSLVNKILPVGSSSVITFFIDSIIPSNLSSSSIKRSSIALDNLS